VKDLIESSGFFAPLPCEVIPEVPKPFDGQISSKDTYFTGVQRYMERTGKKVPNANIFAVGNDDFECVFYYLWR
jgi:hypothetical protein